MSGAVVFAGPSLAGVTPPPGVDLRGPAAAGDLYLAARAGARVIGLVDGVFEDRATTWHNEILWALDNGARIFGAASLGALRAAECAAFGMEGVGEIYARCVSGALDDDHEVALAHAPAELGYAPLSEPLINVRATVEAATAAAVLTPASAAAIVTVAEGLHFKELTWPRLLADAGAAGEGAAAAALAAWLPAGRVDLKRRDALALLETVAAAVPGEGPRIGFRFADSRHWRLAAAAFQRRDAGIGDAGEEVLDELRLDPARFEREMVRAFARRGAREGPARPEADLPGPDELLEDLRHDLGLVTASAFRAWLAQAGADQDALVAAMEDEARLLSALEAAMPSLAGAVLDGLRVDGRYDRLAARAADKRRHLAGIRPPVLQESELPGLLEALCTRRRVQVASDDPDLVARSLGLPDRAALHRMLRRERDYVILSGEETDP